jgi:Cys-tRNA(Pro)/Cys-tRNA(Cys) deacylase
LTPAIKAAQKAGVSYKLHEYVHNPAASSYGDEAAKELKLTSAQVFKTLVVSNNTSQLAVAVTPVSHQLDLKLMAKALGVKKVSMAESVEAEKATGYILGGISPLGQKKRLPFVIDSSANKFETIHVSGGRRGLEIEISASDLIKICNAKVTDIKGK